MAKQRRDGLVGVLFRYTWPPYRRAEEGLRSQHRYLLSSRRHTAPTHTHTDLNKQQTSKGRHTILKKTWFFCPLALRTKAERQKKTGFTPFPFEYCNLEKKSNLVRLVLLWFKCTVAQTVCLTLTMIKLKSWSAYARSVLFLHLTVPL